MLDSARLRGELAHIQKILNGVATGPRGKPLADQLREVQGAATAAIWQSLYADCLRVVYTAIAADNVISDDEIAAVSELIFTIANHYAESLPAYREVAVRDVASIRRFFDHYATDGTMFGARATLHWPGLTLCRRAAQLGETEPLERYERMMSWLIPATCEIGGVTEVDPRWGGRVAELHAMRRTLAQAAKAAAPAADLRLQAFLGQHSVFSAVQQPVSMFDADPFDVEEIHQDARAAFEQLVERALSPAQHAGRNRILLLLGDSGSGKTHLLRSFRCHVQDNGRGLVVYAQMHSAAEDYARYLLHHVVDSLSRPYTGPSGTQTGLFEIAVGLSNLVDDPVRSKILRLAEGDWDVEEISLRELVNQLVDGLRVVPALGKFDADLLRVLLYALAPDERIIAQAYQYLRCEDMNVHDRKWIGDVCPRIRNEHPIQMIRDIARIAYLSRGAALVVMLDQAELSGSDALTGGGRTFMRAVDTLYSIVSEVPSAIAVVACLSNVYEVVRRSLAGAMIDRLENDPPFERLQTNRSYPEIEAIVARRLSWLYGQMGATFRPEDPVYPIPGAALKSLVNRRARDVLQWCDQFQRRCAVAKRLVDASGQSPIDDVEKATDVDTDLSEIATAWNDACHASGIAVPDDPEAILAAVSAAAKFCADELGLSISVPAIKNRLLRVRLAGATEHAELAIAVTNHGYQRGAFGTQLDTLRRQAGDDTPVAVRTLKFPSGKACDEAVAKLLKSGGRGSYLDGSTLRMLAAFQKFQPPFPEERIAAWRRRDRPISSLLPMADLFDLERLRAAAPPGPAGNGAKPAATPPAGVPTVSSGERSGTRLVAKTPRVGVQIIVDSTGVSLGDAGMYRSEASATEQRGEADDSGKRAPKDKRNGKGAANGKAAADGRAVPSQLHIGTASTFDAETRTIEIGSLLRHIGILGSSGSGKTTLALNLIEQVLERDIAVVLVDRKGDLAGYARPDWWRHTADPQRARRLADRLDVRLFTPGIRGGRPLALSVVPDLQQMPDHERDRMVQYAANALAAMMAYGSGTADGACRAILTQAIAVLAQRNRPCGLSELLELLERRDDELLARAGRYDDKRFKKLIEDLETVRLNDAQLFDTEAEALSAETLIGRKLGGKVPLAIATTRFLGDIDRVQAWVAHLIACLSRHAAKSPSAELRMVFMIDEADVFMPAGTVKPPSKEPLQDLLKRARAAGLGIILASQSPADFDYRSREQINTWFLGRIADQRSIDKMRPLFEHRPAVGGKLGSQDPGRFVMLQDGGAMDLGRTPSLLRTEQISEDELMSLAAGTRPRA
jgi:energy-coupling factor transporter ATP-binding protein EcfA2